MTNDAVGESMFCDNLSSCLVLVRFVFSFFVLLGLGCILDLLLLHVLK
jgi:hypothetical protein